MSLRNQLFLNNSFKNSSKDDFRNILTFKKNSEGFFWNSSNDLGFFQKIFMYSSRNPSKDNLEIPSEIVWQLLKGFAQDFQELLEKFFQKCSQKLS